jgi:predicted RNA binding protein YcfA (HicA-like mRNA interferase family)/predicted RNase H-like HicB family nuclease
VKVRDVIKRIEVDGWFLDPTRGSHRQYKHSQKPGIVTIAGKPGADHAEEYPKARQDSNGRYLIILEETSTGFSAYSPDLPESVANDATRQEVEHEIHDAIEFHIEGFAPSR